MDGSSNPYSVVQGQSFAAPLMDWQKMTALPAKPAAAAPTAAAPPGAPMDLAKVAAQPNNPISSVLSQLSAKLPGGAVGGAPGGAPNAQGGQGFAAVLQRLFGGQPGYAPNGPAQPMRNDINGQPIGGPQGMVGPNGPQGLY